MLTNIPALYFEVLGKSPYGAHCALDGCRQHVARYAGFYVELLPVHLKFIACSVCWSKIMHTFLKQS